MKYLAPLLFFWSCLPILQGQISRFREYRKLIHSAEQHTASGNGQEALDYYRQAKREHGYLMVRDLNNAAVNAAMGHHVAEAAGYIMDMVKLGVAIDSVMYLDVFDSVWADKTVKKTLDKAGVVQVEWRKNQNARYRKSLDSLNILVQRNKRGEAPDAGAVALGIVTMIDTWGLPSEQIIGVEGPDGAALYDALFEFMAMHEGAKRWHPWLKRTLFQMLERGCVYPDKVAYWMELMAKEAIFYPQAGSNMAEKSVKMQEKFHLQDKAGYLRFRDFIEQSKPEGFRTGYSISGY
jgi:hypothetical protein